MPSFLLLSDLHLEFQDYTPARSGYDFVILAGDIHTKARGVPWALRQFDCPVIYVCGNHEGYGTHWEKNQEKMRTLAAGSQLSVLDNQRLDLMGVRILATTGWSTFALWPHRAVAMAEAATGRDFYGAGMRDYRLIRTGAYRRLRPADTAAWASRAHVWLTAELQKPFDGPTLIVTHHAPSPLSLEHQKALEPLDAADANPWDDLVISSGAVYWCHGHTHHPVDYRLGATRVISNPRGYPGQSIHHRVDGIWEVPLSRPDSGVLS